MGFEESMKFEDKDYWHKAEPETWVNGGSEEKRTLEKDERDWKPNPLLNQQEGKRSR